MLTILDIGQVDFIFKAINPVNSIENALSRTQADTMSALSNPTDAMKLAAVTPVIEDSNQKKIIGSMQEIVIYVCKKDKRNDQKFDEKGKPIKVKKGTPKAKSLYPIDNVSEVERIAAWFLTKFRPYTNHLFKQVLNYFQQKKQQNEDIQEFNSNAISSVRADIDHILESLKHLDALMGQRSNFNFLCGNDVTMMDIIMFNELSQILCMYTLFAKASGADKEDNLNIEDDYDSDQELWLI